MDSLGLSLPPVLSVLLLLAPGTRARPRETVRGSMRLGIRTAVPRVAGGNSRATRCLRWSNPSKPGWPVSSPSSSGPLYGNFLPLTDVQTQLMTMRSRTISIGAGSIDDTLGLLDSFCDIDSGEGCPPEEPEKASVEIDLEIGDGKQTVPAVFVLGSPNNKIAAVNLNMPLGIVFEETAQGKITVAEVSSDGSAQKNGVQVGDILRATSCVVQKKRADFTYWVGGVGDSGKTRAFFTVDGASFGKAMAEIRSNQQLDGRVTIVIERPE